MDVVISALRRRNHAVPLSVALLGGSLSLVASYLSPIIGWTIVGFTFFWFYIELMTQWSFRAPASRKPPIDDPSWNPMLLSIEGQEIMFYHKNSDPKSPTVVISHGWTSGAMRMTGRAQPFLERGWNVVMFDLPSHGGSSRLTKWTAEESCSLVIKALNAFCGQQDGLFEGPVAYVGHSMGCFIGLRLSKRRTELAFGERWVGWVFESPMTGYTEIFDETCRLLRVPHLFRRLLLRNTIRHFNALNSATTRLTSLNEADMPAWGNPQEPLLLIQASPDERLGDAHHVRLTNEIKNQGREHQLTAHYLTSLSHTGSHVHEERENLIGQWLDAHSSSF